MQNSKHYFDHDADIGIIGYGPTLETCFSNVAQHMFVLMLDIEQVQPVIILQFNFVEDDIELALVTYLNTLLAKAKEYRLMLGSFHLSMQNNKWHAHASGEAWRPDMARGIEVKGATLSMLKVKQENGQYLAQLVVDV